MTEKKSFSTASGRTVMKKGAENLKKYTRVGDRPRVEINPNTGEAKNHVSFKMLTEKGVDMKKLEEVFAKYKEVA